MPEAYINKGSRIRAQWMEARPVCLAGAQLKFGAESHVIVGTIRHLRALVDDPSDILLYVQPDDEAIGGQMCPKCGVLEVEVKPGHVVEVL